MAIQMCFFVNGLHSRLIFINTVVGSFNLLESVCTITLLNIIPQPFACITRERVCEWLAAL